MRHAACVTKSCDTPAWLEHASQCHRHVRWPYPLGLHLGPQTKHTRSHIKGFTTSNGQPGTRASKRTYHLEQMTNNTHRHTHNLLPGGYGPGVHKQDSTLPPLAPPWRSDARKRLCPKEARTLLQNGASCSTRLCPKEICTFSEQSQLVKKAYHMGSAPLQVRPAAGTLPQGAHTAAGSTHCRREHTLPQGAHTAAGSTHCRREHTPRE